MDSLARGRVHAFLCQTREAILDLHGGLFWFGLILTYYLALIHLLDFRGDLRVSPAMCLQH